MEGAGSIVVLDGDDATSAVARAVAERVACPLVVAPALEALGDPAQHGPPALAIVCVELSGSCNGFEAMLELRARYHADLPVILVSATRTEALDRSVGLLLGADDYVSKPFDPAELRARALRLLRRGATNDRVGGSSAGAPDLTPRELEVLQALAAGDSQRDIAATLFISPKTVGTHVQHLLVKLGVHSRAHAVAKAYRLGLLGPAARPGPGPVR